MSWTRGSGRDTGEHRDNSLDDTYAHDDKSKADTEVGWDLLSSTATAELDIAQRREDVRQCSGASRSDQLEHAAKIAS